MKPRHWYFSFVVVLPSAVVGQGQTASSQLAAWYTLSRGPDLERSQSALYGSAIRQAPKPFDIGVEEVTLNDFATEQALTRSTVAESLRTATAGGAPSVQDVDRALTQRAAAQQAELELGKHAGTLPAPSTAQGLVSAPGAAVAMPGAAPRLGAVSRVVPEEGMAPEGEGWVPYLKGLVARGEEKVWHLGRPLLGRRETGEATGEFPAGVAPEKAPAALPADALRYIDESESSSRLLRYYLLVTLFCAIIAGLFFSAAGLAYREPFVYFSGAYSTFVIALTVAVTFGRLGPIPTVAFVTVVTALVTPMSLTMLGDFGVPKESRLASAQLGWFLGVAGAGAVVTTVCYILVLSLCAVVIGAEKLTRAYLNLYALFGLIYALLTAVGTAAVIYGMSCVPLQPYQSHSVVVATVSVFSVFSGVVFFWNVMGAQAPVPLSPLQFFHPAAPLKAASAFWLALAALVVAVALSTIFQREWYLRRHPPVQQAEAEEEEVKSLISIEHEKGTVSPLQYEGSVISNMNTQKA